jgi:hypothetical protein
MEDLIMYKKVNIYPSTPIIGVNPPIRSAVRHVTKSIKDIRTCIMSRAKVEEILPDGSIIRLGLNNYDKENYVLPESVVDATVDNTNESETVTTNETVTDDAGNEADEINVDAVWNAAYNKALAGKDLESMTKKQRKDAKAEARATADAAVAVATSNTTVANTDEPESVTADETVSDETASDEVTTNDAEDLTGIVE